VFLPIRGKDAQWDKQVSISFRQRPGGWAKNAYKSWPTAGPNATPAIGKYRVRPGGPKLLALFSANWCTCQQLWWH